MAINVQEGDNTEQMDAEAAVNRFPKSIPLVEIQLYRSEFEPRFYKLKNSECPSKASFEDLCEQMDNGEFRDMALRHFSSRNADEEAESGNLQLGKSGVVKIRKSKVEISNPSNMEEFKAKMIFMVNHFVFARVNDTNLMASAGLATMSAPISAFATSIKDVLSVAIADNMAIDLTPLLYNVSCIAASTPRASKSPWKSGCSSAIFSACVKPAMARRRYPPSRGMSNEHGPAETP